MGEFSRFFLLALAGSALILGVIGLPLVHYLGSATVPAIAAGGFVGLINIAIAYIFNRKAFVDSGKSLLKTFFSGMLLRFLVIALFTFLVAKFTNLNLIAFVLALAACYLLLQFLEVRYLQAQLGKNQEATK